MARLSAPTAIRVNPDSRAVENESPLIPDVAGLTDAVLGSLAEKDQNTVNTIRTEIEEAGESTTIESILTQVRRLAQAIGDMDT